MIKSELYHKKYIIHLDTKKHHKIIFIILNNPNIIHLVQNTEI